MITHRIIYALTLIALFIFYILYPPWISWYLIVIVLLMIPVDLIVSLPGMLTKGLLVSVPSVLEKDADAVFILKTTHTKKYPVRGVIARLQVTGDDFSVKCRISCPAEDGATRDVTIDTSHSGVTVFFLKRFSTVSLLGLFSLPVNAGDKRSVLILPPIVKPSNTLALQRGTQLRPKPGGGFSEDHDMRMYRHGDPVRSIHWKVSAKFDSLIIRESLEPPPHSRLIHIMQWNNVAERDLILGRLRWVTNYMLKRQMAFYIKYSDDATVSEITKEEDLIDFLQYVLNKLESKVVKSDRVPTRFSWIYRVDSKGG